MGGSQLVPRLWERALRRTVPAPGGPHLFKIAQAISGLVSREFGSQCRSFLTRGGREGVGSSRVLFSEQCATQTREARRFRAIILRSGTHHGRSRAQ